jgi:hypothetical protein
VDRTILEADQAKGVWRYAISLDDRSFRQTIYQAVGGDFYTQVRHISTTELEGRQMEIDTAIMMVEGPFATHDEAIECGESATRHWVENDQSNVL